MLRDRPSTSRDRGMGINAGNCISHLSEQMEMAKYINKQSGNIELLYVHNNPSPSIWRIYLMVILRGSFEIGGARSVLHCPSNQARVHGSGSCTAAMTAASS